MAIYEYECKKCGVLEIEHSIKDNAKTKCPECKGKIKRILSATNFQGGGFPPHGKPGQVR